MIPGVKRVCLKCGVLTGHGSYCQDCAVLIEQQRSRARGRRHYDAAYVKAARQVRAEAVTCWLCGEGARPLDPWTADHLVPGVVGSPLAPAHRSCNSRRGNRSTIDSSGK